MDDEEYQAVVGAFFEQVGIPGLVEAEALFGRRDLVIQLDFTRGDGFQLEALPWNQSRLRGELRYRYVRWSDVRSSLTRLGYATEIAGHERTREDNPLGISTLVTVPGTSQDRVTFLFGVFTPE